MSNRGRSGHRGPYEGAAEGVFCRSQREWPVFTWSPFENFWIDGMTFVNYRDPVIRCGLNQPDKGGPSQTTRMQNMKFINTTSPFETEDQYMGKRCIYHDMDGSTARELARMAGDGSGMSTGNAKNGGLGDLAEAANWKESWITRRSGGTTGRPTTMRRCCLKGATTPLPRRSGCTSVSWARSLDFLRRLGARSWIRLRSRSRCPRSFRIPTTLRRRRKLATKPPCPSKKSPTLNTCRINPDEAAPAAEAQVEARAKLRTTPIP